MYADFYGARLFGASFIQASLTNADFTAAEMQAAVFEEADLTGADLFYVEAFNAVFDNAALAGMDGSFGDFGSCSITNSDLTGADFRSAILSGSIMDFDTWKDVKLDTNTIIDPKPRLIWSIVNAGVAGENLTNQDLSLARLMGGNLNGANLSNADFNNSDLTGADLRGANLTGANLDFTILQNVQIDANTIIAPEFRLVILVLNQGGAGLDLRGTNLSNTIMLNAVFTGANLSNADCSESVFEQANFNGANLTQCQPGILRLQFGHLHQRHPHLGRLHRRGPDQRQPAQREHERRHLQRDDLQRNHHAQRRHPELLGGPPLPVVGLVPHAGACAADCSPRLIKSSSHARLFAAVTFHAAVPAGQKPTAPPAAARYCPATPATSGATPFSRCGLEVSTTNSPTNTGLRNRRATASAVPRRPSSFSCRWRLTPLTASGFARASMCAANWSVESESPAC